jgi:two-component system nitrate/nitrite response regulator NarL
MIRVLVAENSRIHTRLLADALKRDPLLEVTPFESESSGLISAVATQQIDVALISSVLDDQPSRGFEILHDLRSARKETRAVLLLGSSKDEVILKAFRAGARGLFTENDPLELLTECVRSVHQGNIWANQHAFGIAVEALANSPNVRTSDANGMKLLSKRELQVVRSLAEGLTNREIAEQLNLSPHTIKNYLFRIFDKLGVSSRIELLFMSLSQTDAVQSTNKLSTEALRGNEYSDSEAALLERSAEAGLPAAQLALAQLYFFRRRDSQDLISAYTWYLVATERAMLARGLMTKLLAPEQIDEAKRKATAWLSKMRRIPPSSTSSEASEVSNPSDGRRQLV